MPYARNGDVRIHYIIEGTGPPLVLQHGFTGSWRDWETFGFVAALQDDYQLIMLDARGHGASDTPHDPASYGLTAAAEDIVAVLDDLGIDQAHYYGYSFGGAVGWALGTSAPERVASLAIGGAHPYPPSDEVGVRITRMHDYLSQGMAAYVAWRERQLGPWPPAFRARVLGNDARALAACVTPHPDRPRLPRVEEALPQMTMPVLLLSGDDDELFAGSRARLAASLLPDGRFVEVAGANHFTLYVRSDLVLPHVCAFLSQVTASQLAHAGP